MGGESCENMQEMVKRDKSRDAVFSGSNSSYAADSVCDR